MYNLEIDIIYFAILLLSGLSRSQFLILLFLELKFLLLLLFQFQGVEAQIVFFQVFLTQLEAVAQVDRKVDGNCQVVQADFEYCQLDPTEVFQKPVHMFAREVPVQKLDGQVGNAPVQVHEVFGGFGRYQHDLVVIDEVKHCQKGPAMHVHRESLDQKSALVVRVDDSFVEENSQAPETDHHDGLDRKGHKVQTGQKPSCVEGGLFLMEDDGKEKIKADQNLGQIGELAEVEHGFVVDVDVHAKNNGVEQ